MNQTLLYEELIKAPKIRPISIPRPFLLPLLRLPPAALNTTNEDSLSSHEGLLLNKKLLNYSVRD